MVSEKIDCGDVEMVDSVAIDSLVQSDKGNEQDCPKD